MDKTTSILSTLIILVCFAGNLESQAITTTGQTIAIVDKARPLAEFADSIEKLYGVAVNYEDVELAFQGDLRTVNSALNSSLSPHLIQLPRRGSFTVKSTLPKKNASIAQVNQLLGEAIIQHTASNLPGNFGHFIIGNTLVIKPTATKDVGGILKPIDALLDRQITAEFNPETKTIQAVEEVCRLLTVVSGKKVLTGTVPINLLSQTSVNLPSETSPARDVLHKLLTQMQWADKSLEVSKPQISWQLFYGTDIHAYVLNMHVVSQLVPTPVGGEELVPIRLR